MTSRIASLGAAMALVFAVGCSTSVDDDRDDTEIADPLADDYDECAVRGWYADGQCDTGCLDPDPDCVSAECDDACAGYCDASWSGDALPALPDGCTVEMCDCGEPPVECPDLCEAQCYGEPLPDQIPPDCPSFTCDCAEVTADPDASGIVAAAGAGARCGSRAPDAATRSELYAADSAAAFLSAASNVSAARRTIPLVYHVIRRTRPKYGGTGAGDVPRKTLIKQLKVMNRAYARSPFKFKLSKITRTTNTSWFLMNIDSEAERSAKRKLHRGGKSTMNVYTTGTDDALGWAYLPAGVAGTPLDGIVLDYGSLPGGNKSGYNHGDTLVHEGGHWFGLEHTFEGDCDGGDGVADTPAESSPASGCPVGRDSCPNKKGKDPVKNYMDYSDDACINQFSAGQRGRMGRVTKKYRGSREEGTPGCGDGTCSGNETDSSCPTDCGCAAVICSGVTPFGCYCDPDCEAIGDCCADADTCE